MTPQDASQVLTSATLRAADLLGLDDQELGQVIGYSASEAGLLRGGLALVQADTYSGTRCLLLVRMFQAVEALVGGDRAKLRLWLRGFDKGVGGVPGKHISTEAGLIRTVEYLESRLGR
jgi:hypothetical protein